MKRIILIGGLALCCIALCCVVLTGCGAKVTGFEIALPESLPVGEASIAEINATYDKPEATDEQKAKALDALGVTFTSSDEAIATVDTSGKVTAVAGGKVIITATAKELSANKEIAVLVPLESVTAPETLELILNKTDSETLGAKPKPENANVKGVLTYKSSDEKIATVDEKGTVTAVANGEAVITITADDKTAETKVTVTTAATGIALESTAGWVYVGGAYELKPHTVPTEAAASSYTYASDNTGVATVSDKGVITGKIAGSAKITVTSAEGFTAEYAITVKVKPAATKPSGGKTGTGTGGGTTAGGGNNTGGSTGGGTPSGGGTAPAPDPVPPAPPELQHYHGNGSDTGACPVCGAGYSPSIGVGGGAGNDVTLG